MTKFIVGFLLVFGFQTNGRVLGLARVFDLEGRIRVHKWQLYVRAMRGVLLVRIQDLMNELARMLKAVRVRLIWWIDCSK